MSWFWLLIGLAVGVPIGVAGVYLLLLYAFSRNWYL